MIHVLNFDGKIVDYISKKDNAVYNIKGIRDSNERIDTFDFTIIEKRSEHFKERNRIIVKDMNDVYREYIIINASINSDGYVDVQCNASYVEDLIKGKPIAPGKYNKFSTTQSLSQTIVDTGWEVAPDTEYCGLKTTTWTEFHSPYDIAKQLETTYRMKLDFYIQLGANTVKHRYARLRFKRSLFKGKEITYGNDLLNIKRTIDFSNVVTALIGLGPVPEQEEGKPPKPRLQVLETDIFAQSRFGLPERYLYDFYEPQTDDQNMTEKRLRTLTREELNKRNKAVITYEITNVDLKASHEKIEFGDTIRVKDRQLHPPLYLEAEVIREEWDPIANESTYTFGQIKEYEEKDLRKIFERLRFEIQMKLQDRISNVESIITKRMDGTLAKFEPKIIKSDAPPENPVEDMLWLDTSNPNVAVLRRYKDGKWIKSSVDDISQLGGLTREQSMLHDLRTSFELLAPEDAKLSREVGETLNSQYLLDEDVKSDLRNKLDALSGVFIKIKESLDSMTDDTATIGQLVETQKLFKEYREKLHALYVVIEQAKLLINDRFKLLQSQYSDEKFNEAMDKVAHTLPNGHWNPDTRQLTSDIPNKKQIDAMQANLETMLNGQLKQITQTLTETIDSKIKIAKDEISFGVSSVEKKIEDLSISGTNLIRGAAQFTGPFNHDAIANYGKMIDGQLWSLDVSPNGSKQWSNFQDVEVEPNTNYTLSYDAFAKNTSSNTYVPILKLVSKGIKVVPDTVINWENRYQRATNQQSRLSQTFNSGDTRWIRLNFTSDDVSNPVYISKPKLERGIVATPFSESPFDSEAKLNDVKIDIQSDYLRKIAEAKNETTQVFTQKLAESKVESIADVRQKIELSKQETTQDFVEKLNSLKSSSAAELTNKLNEVKQNTANEISGLTTQIVAKQNELTNKIDMAKQEATNAANEYASTQDTLIKTEANAYADNIVTKEEKRSIEDVKTKLEEAKKYADTKSSDAVKLANQKLEQEVAPIKLSVKTQSADIKLLKDSISLKASSDEVSRLIDRSLQPLSQSVQSNKSSLDVLPAQIATKVSKSDYDTTMQGLVTRIDNSDSERIQLSNRIDDIVTKYDLNTLKGTLTDLRTSVSQTANDIELKASKQEFDVNNRTLSNVISKIVNSTTEGLRLSYDDNGTISSMSMDYNGIKLNSNKIDIDNGDVIIRDGRTTIKDAYINTLFANNAFIEKLKALEIDASRIKTGILQSRSGDIRWDMDRNDLNFYNSASIQFHTANNALTFRANNKVAYINFTLTSGTKDPAIVVGANRSNALDPNLPTFSGLLVHCATDSIHLIGDTIRFQNNNIGEKSGGWEMTTYEDTKYRVFKGSYTKNYKYDLGYSDAKFNSVWTNGLNANLRVVDYKSGRGAITSLNGVHGIEVGNSGFYIVYANHKYSVQDLLNGKRWKV